MYSIDLVDTANTVAPANFSWLIYAAAQEGLPTAFLKCDQGERERGVQISLLHPVSNYVPRMGLTVSPWHHGSFTSKGVITCGNITGANCLPASLHNIRDTFYVPPDQAIDTTLAANPYTNLLGSSPPWTQTWNPSASARPYAYPRHFSGSSSSVTSCTWSPGPVSAAPLLMEVKKLIVVL